MATTSSSISSPGLGSGLDVKGIVDKLVSIEHRPVDLVQKQQAGLQAKISSFGLIKSYVSNLHDVSGQLAASTLWHSTSVASADASAVSASVRNTGPAPGSYKVQTTRLAQAQTLVSASASDSQAALGSGRLRIELGAWADDLSGFAPKTGATALDLDIAPPEDTLEGVRDRINAAKAGVSASILRDANGARLVLGSSGTGLQNGIRITASGAGGNGPAPAGLAALAYDPPGAAAGMTRAQAACNALANINGVEVSSASNTLDGAVEGLTITLSKAGGAAVDLNVRPDTEAMRKAVTSFVGAYNDIAKYLAAQTKYDAVAKSAATLQGDATTIQLQRTMRGALSDPSAASSTYARLLDVGIHLNSDNTLAVDGKKLDAALAHPDELARAFSSETAGHAESDGFGVRFKKLTAQVTAFDGVVTLRSQALNSAVSAKQAQVSAMEDRLTGVQQRLLARYTALDTQMSALSSKSSYVTQQLKALSAQSSSN